MNYDLYAVAKNSTTGVINRVNVSSGSIVGTIALPTGVNSIHPQITLNAARTRAWVAIAQPVAPYSNYVVTIDTTTDTIIHTTTLSGSSTYTRGVLSPDETTLYLSDGTNYIWSMNTSTYALGTEHASFSIAGVSPDNSKLYGQSSTRGEIVNASGYGVLYSWTGMGSPFNPVSDLAGTTLVNYDPSVGGNIYASNLSTHSTVGSTSGAYGTPFPSPLGTYFGFASRPGTFSNSATFFRTSSILAGTFTIAGSYSPSGGVWSLAITPDDQTAYIIADPGTGGRNLVTYSLSSMSVSSTVALGTSFSPISTGLVPSNTTTTANPVVMII